VALPDPARNLSTGSTARTAIHRRASHARWGPAAVQTRAIEARRTRDSALRRALLAGDLAALLLAAGAAFLTEPPRDGQELAMALVFLPFVPLLAKLYGLYEGSSRRISHSTIDDIPDVFHVMLIGTLGLWGFLKLFADEHLAFAQAAVFLLTGIAATLAARGAVRMLMRRFGAPERVLIVGDGMSARLLANRLASGPRYRGTVVGYLSDGGRVPGAELQHLGSCSDFAAVCRGQRVDRALIASPALGCDDLTDIVRQGIKADVKVSLLPTMADVLGPATQLDELQGVMLLGVNPARFTRSSSALKRTLDLSVSLAGIVLLLPLLPLVAAAIKLDSPGPVFYAQERMGRRGRRFRLYKLRTMAADAEQRAAALRSQSRHAAWLLLDHDPRITRVGRILRMTSIDELPQLWNVVRGEMSLVGPRPMPADVDRHINGWGRLRLDLAPGITGLWQVLGRASIPFEEMLKLDYVYVTNWSVWEDLRLMLRTVFAVISMRGAG
jgi:exopolysaccharide biosynthesis polyprenyl glycosylphosphotransferase